MSRRDRPAEWHPTAGPHLPWEAAVDGERRRLRLDDVRDGSPLCSLLVDGAVVEVFDRWPACWEKVDAWERGSYEHEMERLERTRSVRPSPARPTAGGFGVNG